MESMNPKAVLVLVNYFGEPELNAFIHNHLLSESESLERVYIVNNGSHDTTVLDTLAGRYQWIKIIHPGKNVGYLPAAHLAWADYTNETGVAPSFFILSNYDLEPEAVGWLQRLLLWASNQQPDVFAPQIVAMPSGKKINPFYRKRLSAAHLRRLIIVTQFYPLYVIYQWLHLLKRKVPAENTHELYALHGSFLGFSRSFFDKHGSIDYPCTLYGEELFIAEQSRALGLRMAYRREEHLFHHEHISTGSIKNKKHMRMLHQSLKFIFNTYYT
jgi:GT2 family glycosyltransferase